MLNKEYICVWRKFIIKRKFIKKMNKKINFVKYFFFMYYLFCLICYLDLIICLIYGLK